MTTQQKDGIQTGLPSTGNVANPSNPNGDTITLTTKELQKKIDEAANLRHSKLDTQIADLTKRLTTANESIVKLEDARRKAELDSAAGAPETVSLIQARHKLEDAQRELDKRQAVIDAREKDSESLLSTANMTLLEKDAERIAGETGIKKEILLKYGGDSTEKLTEYANSLKEAGIVPQTGQPNDGGAPPAPRPGAASQSGASGKTDEQKLADRYPTMVSK